ncbi:DUF309 domain-containing protein [Alicyclobacillus kakegawensis]|uniref:DUF309 domain-containing protein n=1 Tax=Alicyclobacillus kakegawensis TaxID=392012 RepID=UPI00082C3EEB|nr:DUF309 domain-containing protein [Alicyclobacillus kakegawensis]
MDPRLGDFVYDFNERRDYFACHEHLESLWLDSGRPEVLKGLIQAAVCLYHLESGNVRGAIRMWSRARPRLEAAGPTACGLDIEGLVRDLRRTFAQVPEAWRTHTLPPSQARTLDLPPVRLRIVDPELETCVNRRKQARE